MKQYKTLTSAKAQATALTKKTGVVHTYVIDGDMFAVGTEVEVQAFLAEQDAAAEAATVEAAPKAERVTIAMVASRNLPIVEAVKAYAMGNYDRGWDVVAECWTDADIEKAVGKSKNLNAALLKVYPFVKAYNNQKKEVEATAF